MEQKQAMKNSAKRASPTRTRSLRAKTIDPSEPLQEQVPTPKAPLSHEDIAFRLAKYGYCLWLGAGVSKQLSGGTGVQIPLWGELVTSLEAQLHIPAAGKMSWPDRLNRIRWKVGPGDFQRLLRVNIAVPVAAALLVQLEAWVKTGEVPSAIEQLNLFGAFATSVVNFNIETMSSRVVAAASPYKLKIFHPPAEGSSGWHIIEGKADGVGSGAVPLSIIHPHGAVDKGGLCVMTSEEYRLLNGTLGLEIAVHKCFEDNVLILGMSLEDEYLRHQLVAFRSQIKNVTWMNLGKPPGEPLYSWAAANRIDIVVFNSPREMWGLFTRYAKVESPHDTKFANGFNFILNMTTHERRLNMAHRMREELEQIANLAFDVPEKTSEALRQLRDGPASGDVRHLAAQLIWGSDRGEDASRPSSLTDSQRERIRLLGTGLGAWETNTREAAEKRVAEADRLHKRRVQRRLRELKRQEAEEKQTSRKRRKKTVMRHGARGVRPRSPRSRPLGHLYISSRVFLLPPPQTFIYYLIQLNWLVRSQYPIYDWFLPRDV
jgi:hypothetical protein